MMGWISKYWTRARQAACRHKWDRNGADVMCRKCLKVDIWKSLENAGAVQCKQKVSKM